jgi:iron complex outermembrane receptor protein
MRTRTLPAAAPALCLASLACLASSSALAQGAAPAVVLEPVVVSAQRTRESAFDASASISAVTRETIENAGPQVNLSEALRGVPGISVLNRQNYAQDVQLSIRGFGARSTFGIRGVRLIVDGIPATMPDGQGQASSIALSSAGRIEVLRGPLAQLYGNAAGGVVQVFTEDDAAVPTATVSAAAGPSGLWRLGSKFSTGTSGWGLTVDASSFKTDGWRAHSEAERRQLNARWQADLTPELHSSVVLNVLDQPVSDDPGGLTRAQWETDPRQAAPNNLAQDARKTVRQSQIGNVNEWRIDGDTQATARVYAGQRDLDNALSTPLAAQMAPTSSGGIVRFERSYAGGGLVLSRGFRLEGGSSVRVTAGVELDHMREDRQGYLNEAGVQGALKRDERNTVSSRDVFVQASWNMSAAWTLTAGARRSSVRFSSSDRFITPTNPDDSGSVEYSATNPVAGLAWRPDPTLNVYANVGRGFETPTFTELAYRPAATGLNTALSASRSRHAEIGFKWRPTPAHRLDVAAFDIGTRDEIVVDSNEGGRSTFKNAGPTRRRGIELSYAGQLTDAVRATLSFTQLRARFREGFTSGSGPAAVPVAAGNRLPGTPERSAFAELAWKPVAGPSGFHAAVEAQHNSRLYVNDANDDAAPAATVFNLRAGFAQQVEGWRFSQLIRLENATDKRYAGSVIVGEANRRYFEPALGRNWLLAVTARYEFR